MKKKGFTLLEIIVVLVIVGLLAAFSVSIFSASIEQTKAQMAEQNLMAISAAQQKYYEDNNGVYCLAGCADNVAGIYTNLHLSISDGFTYQCSSVPPTVYTCTAQDSTDSITMGVASNANNGVLMPTICCTVLQGGANNCPSGSSC